MRKILPILLLIYGATQTASAQFYNQGVESPRTKWKQVNTSKYRLVYPIGFEQSASRYTSILDTIYPYINYNFKDPVRKIPIILRTKNHLSNGFVTWSPKREELITNLAGNTYALPWAKQLAIHEGRHVAQMSIMKTGITKGATWFLGESGISIALLVIAKWQLEGDAVLAETQFAEYGRGLQPDFTLIYRGLAAGGKLNFKHTDKWIYGSYKQHIPNIYEYGYQLMSAMETYLTPTIWYDVAKHSSRYPILIFPRKVYLKRHHNTSYKIMAQRAFAELDSIWQPTYSVANSFELLTTPKKIHTEYTNPISYNDQIIATKWDFNHPTRLISIDTITMKEQTIHHTGYITSRPIIANNKIYWTEYKAHPFYQQQNYSAIRSLDLTTGKRRTHKRYGINYHITPMPEGNIAAITLDNQSNGYIRITDSKFKNGTNITFDKEPTTLHGLAWDNHSQKLYYIALSDRGMWIGSTDINGNLDEITHPSVVSIQDLRAAAGKLYFSSIQSGKNEIHTINLTTGEEHRQTESNLASTSPSPTESGEILMSSYTPLGWAIARTDTKNLEQITWNRLPKNTLNPTRYKWDVPTIDHYTVTVDSADITAKSKRYRKIGHGLSFHTWAPIPFTGDLSMSEGLPVLLAPGASVLFQSRLSEIQGFAAYGWVNKMHWGKANITYSGLPIRISLNAEYGGGHQNVYKPGGSTIPDVGKLTPFLSLGATLSLPVNLSKGANSRLLQPSVTLTHQNAQYYDINDRAYHTGRQTYSTSLYWASIRSQSYRAIQPRLGYALQLTNSGSINPEFNKLYAFTAKGYLPGIGLSHSLSLTASIMHQTDDGTYMLTGKTIVPRGLTNKLAVRNYIASQASYFMPIAHPDTGIDGIIYLKRISAELFYDFSRGEYFTNIHNTYRMRNHYATGITVGIENVLLGLVKNTMYFTFSNDTESKIRFNFAFSFSL